MLEAEKLVIQFASYSCSNPAMCLWQPMDVVLIPADILGACLEEPLEILALGGKEFSSSSLESVRLQLITAC